MTVQELIYQLELQPSDMEVVMYEYGDDATHEINRITRKFLKSKEPFKFYYCSETAEDAQEYLIIE